MFKIYIKKMRKIKRIKVPNWLYEKQKTNAEIRRDRLKLKKCSVCGFYYCICQLSLYNWNFKDFDILQTQKEISINDYVIFKSENKFFWKEKKGIKNNTIRIFGNNDPRKEILDNMIKSKNYGKIIIMHSENCKIGFTRKICDISKYKQMYIITWLRW